MVDKRFYRPVEIAAWVIVVYERPQRFKQENAQDMIRGMLDSFREVGK